MSRTPIIILGSFAVLLAAGVAGVFAYDSARSDVIANGVQVGAVDVGGLSSAAARAKIMQRLVRPLQASLVVTAGRKTYALSAREAHISANLEAMVHAALQRSRDGGVLARTWRGLTGSEVDARIAPAIAYSRPAVQRMVDRVRVAVSRRAVDATVSFQPDTVAIRHARTGRSIDAAALRSSIEEALVSATHDRTLEVPIRTVKPRVSGDKLAKKYPVVLTVDRRGFRISLFKHLQRVRTYPIAVGQAGLETPAGLYKIANKATNPAWHVPNSAWAGSLAGQVIPGGAANNPIKARWLGVYDGVGVHGTTDRASIGTNASHGCIRMLVEDVEKLYDQVPIGTPIFIH
ncbi:MAG: L,D-transpeptidase ErfK/SrfK [Solirubrobacteraceae bacterium]|jgi:lipoprotein-anchoring transpeptidase ErfK/SrfK|nr:L,D-transpeptidase ErfK/SrfK [Solirubrobacteraceae bacterium]